MKKNFLICLLVILSNQVFSQTQNESESIFYKKSLTMYLRNISFEGGVGGTFWFNEKYSVILLINGSAEGQTYSSSTGNVTKTDIYLNPITTIRRHVFEKSNITPFIGATVQPTWYVGEISKRTEFLYGVVFGVESWITENISITGEQSILNRIPINNPNDYSDTFGRSSISISFYY